MAKNSTQQKIATFWWVNLAAGNAVAWAFALKYIIRALVS
jgi:hypothetical protein